MYMDSNNIILKKIILFFLAALLVSPKISFAEKIACYYKDKEGNNSSINTQYDFKNRGNWHQIQNSDKINNPSLINSFAFLIPDNLEMIEDLRATCKELIQKNSGAGGTFDSIKVFYYNSIFAQKDYPLLEKSKNSKLKVINEDYFKKKIEKVSTNSCLANGVNYLLPPPLSKNTSDILSSPLLDLLDKKVREEEGISITNIKCPKTKSSDPVEDYFWSLYGDTILSKLIDNFLDNHLDHVIGSSEANKCFSKKKLLENKEFQKTNKEKRILVLGSDDSNYHNIAQNGLLGAYDNLTCDPLLGMDFTKDLKIECFKLNTLGWKYMLIHKMLFNAEEMHFLLDGSYPEIKNPEEKIQKMINNWEKSDVNKSNFFTDWEMWFVNCSKFAPYLKLKLEYHQ